MLHEDIYITSTASWLPSTLTPVQTGLESGEFSIKDFQDMGYESIAIAPLNISVEAMALQAADKAMKRAKIQGHQLAALTFNGVHRHGHPQFWCPASYLQDQLSATEALPYSIYQGCNGQLLSIAMLRSILATSHHDYALSVTADQFTRGGANRWHADYGIVYADAAAAIVLSKRPGIAKIVSMHTFSNPSLESLHRFDEPFHFEDTDFFNKMFNTRLTKKQFLEKFGKDYIMHATKDAMQTLWDKTFADMTLTPEDINVFIFPNLSESVLDTNYFSIYEKVKEKSLWCLGKTLGHMGASDVVVGLTHLFENNQIQCGDKVLCIGAGSGFSWTFMVIEKC